MASLSIISVLLALARVAADQAACIGDCAAARDDSNHEDPEVMFLHTNLTTEELTPKNLMAEVKALTAELQTGGRHNLSDLEAVLSQDALSQVPATSEVWGKLTNMSAQILSTLFSDTQSDQASIDDRRSQFEGCEDMPEEDIAIIADVSRKSSMVTNAEGRKESSRRGTVSFNFGTSISTAEGESSSQQYLINRRMEQYMVILADLASAQGELNTAQAALVQANEALVRLKNNCRCTRKTSFEEEVQEVLARVELREGEESIAMLLQCMGEKPTLAEKTNCANTNSSSALPTMNNTVVQLPAGTQCVSTAALPQEMWGGPLDTDIPGVGFRSFRVRNVNDCKKRCIRKKRCQAIQFSSTDRHRGRNCFLHANQADTARKYKSFQVYKLTRPPSSNQV
jgi:hypothetical protein